jgi:hypothetical protein
MAKWLDKYEQGGLVLKKKTKDNYGKQSNYNDSKTSVDPDFVGLGYNTKGRDYSPAWGGQFQNGGNLWNTDKKAFVDSTLNANKNLDFVHRLYDPSLGSIQIPGEHGRSTHYMANDKTRAYPEVVNINGKLQYLPGDKGYDYADSTGEYINFKTPEQAEWFASSRDNTSGYKMGTNVLSNISKKGKPKMQMGGGIPGAVGFTYARTAGSAPANGKYTKKTKASAKNGSVIKDDMGQWAHPGEITEIGSNNITMQGVDYPVLGVSDTGHTQMMQPGQDYKFDGEKVTEYPMMQEGGWLSKYDNISATSPLKKQAEEFLARRNANRPTMSQYTPKAGEAERLDREKLQRIQEENSPLNKMAASKGAANLWDAGNFALDIMGAAEGLGAAKNLLKKAPKFNLSKAATTVAEDRANKAVAENILTSPIITRGPINYWEEPGFAKRNPNFNPEAYANSPVGNPNASRDIPKGMEPRLSKDQNGGWLNKYK